MQHQEQIEATPPQNVWTREHVVQLSGWREGTRQRVEVTAKDGDTVRWYGRELQLPHSVSEVLAACKKHGEPLVRPFALGAPFDEGAGPCVAALLRNCVMRLTRGGTALAMSASDLELAISGTELQRAAAIGDWQGVDYPKAWRESEVRRLCAYLREWYGLGELAEHLERLPSDVS
jgi:hypothetical protein